ncbi:MAG: hypothetical protein ACTSYF_14215 [Promethearchaeota archaeon]
MKSPKEKQLTLDYFAGTLKTIQNDITKGKKDPLVPLESYIKAFNELSEHRLEKLHEFTELFGTLCDIFDYKINAFKALLFSLKKIAITKLLENEDFLGRLVSSTSWFEPFSFTELSTTYIRYIFSSLKKVPTRIPVLEFDELQERESIKYQLNLEEKLFSEEKLVIIGLIENVIKQKNKKDMELIELSKMIKNTLNLDDIKVFILILHLIQEGYLIYENNSVIFNNQRFKY